MFYKNRITRKQYPEKMLLHLLYYYYNHVDDDNLYSCHVTFFSLSEICLNVRDPPTEISIIPEEMVKPEWGLPEVKYRFITR